MAVGDNKKVLFVATVSKHILRFHLPFLKWFQENGYETHVASSGNESIPYCSIKHKVPFSRSPYSIKNIAAYLKLKRIIEKNKYMLIHAHTPMGGVIARLSSLNARRNGTKVLYTSHGFHFFKGAPLVNWIFYFPVEKILSRITDGIITINKEDYNLLFRSNFKTRGKYLINGIGVDEKRFVPVTEKEKSELRKLFGYRDDQFILIYVAEFINRKNHKFIVESIPLLSAKIPELKIIFAGRGKLLEEMKDYSRKMNVSEWIDFLGFRNDVERLMAVSDIGISSSKQEGLGLNLAEEMLIGLPIVATDDRGHRELVISGFNGFLFDQNNKRAFVDYIVRLASDIELRRFMGDNSKAAAEKFTLKKAMLKMEDIYKNYLDPKFTH
jgi:glycosyltransferase EpsD